MGLSPIDVGQMTLAQYLAACAAWSRAHGGEEKIEPPTAEEYYQIVGVR